MAKGKTSSFKGVGDDPTQEVHVVQDAQEAQDVHEEARREYGTTQGRKGQHAKRINMAFSDINHEYITKESRRRGMSATAFVNKILDSYRSNEDAYWNHGTMAHG